MLRICLPFPDRELNPNTRKVCQASLNPKREARDTGYFAAMEDCHKRGTGSVDSLGIIRNKPLRLRIAIYPPDNRRRDMDNIVAALKSYQDGIFRYIDMDDSKITYKEVIMRRSCPEGKIIYLLYQR